jgi:hypothetical protein
VVLIECLGLSSDKMFGTESVEHIVHSNVFDDKFQMLVEYLCRCENFVPCSVPYRPEKCSHFSLKTTSTEVVFQNVTGFFCKSGNKSYIYFYMQHARGKVEVFLTPGSAALFKVMVPVDFLYRTAFNVSSKSRSVMQEGEQVGVEVRIASSSDTALHISIHTIQKLGVGWNISTGKNKETLSATAPSSGHTHKQADSSLSEPADVLENFHKSGSSTCSNSQVEIFYSDDSSTEEENVKWVEVVAEEKEGRGVASCKVFG